MSKITVTTFSTAAGSQWSGSTAYLRIYYYNGSGEAFSFSTGEVWQPSVETFYREIACTLSGGVVTVPPFVLDTTTDVVGPFGAALNMLIVDASRNESDPIRLAQDWQVPTSLEGLTVVTYEQLRQHNRPARRQLTDTSQLSRTQWELMLADALAVTPRGITGVADIATLTALASDELTNGQVVYVAAYATAGDGGGGFFRWDGTSTAETDGGVTFIPDDLTAAGSPYSLTYATLTSNGVNGYVQLPQTNVVWGSVSITYNDGAGAVGSKWLHGHGVTPRHGIGAPARSAPVFEHGAGKVWGDGLFRIRNLVDSNTANAASTLNYRYATGAGRWVRQLPDDCVTPAMFGGKAGDSTFDSSFYTAWALQWLNGQDKIKRLHFDGTYYIKGFWGEIYSGITLTGRGMEVAAVKYMGDQGDGSGGVIDFLKDIYINSPSPDTNKDPYYLLGLCYPGALQFDNATGFGFRDFLIDGNIENNLYFLAGVGWDTTAITGRVSQRLRESPTYSGFWVITQDGRYVAAKTRWFMHNVHIKGMGGTCYGYSNGGSADNRNVRLGNSLSGRVLYGGQGKNNGLALYGYTRTSFMSPYSGFFENLSIEDTVANPWAANALDPAYFVFRGKAYRDADETGDPVAEERYGMQEIILSDFAFDMSGQTGSGQAILKHTGETLRASKGRVKGPATGQLNVLAQTDVNQTGGAAGMTVEQLVVHNRSASGTRLVLMNLSGFYQHLVMRDIHIVETYSGANKLTKTTLPVLPTSNFLSINMDPHPGGSVPPVPLQLIELDRINDETDHAYLLEAFGLSNASGEPTLVRISNSTVNLYTNQWAVDGDTGAMPVSAPTLRVELTNVVIDTYDPGENFRGDAVTLDRLLARSILRNCRTSDGRVSEVDKVVTRTVVDAADAIAINALGYIDFTTDLMWTPLTYGATPLSANAVTRGITSVAIRQDPSIHNGSVTNTSVTKLRVGVGAVSSGDVLTYRIVGAVAPPRTL